MKVYKNTFAIIDAKCYFFYKPSKINKIFILFFQEKIIFCNRIIKVFWLICYKKLLKI